MNHKNLNLIINQLESVTFQGSVCALTQTIFELNKLDTQSFILDIFEFFYYNYKSVVRRVTSDHFGEVISRIIQVIKEGRTYIYNLINRRVVPSNGLNNYLTESVMHSCNLFKNNQLKSVTFQGSACALTQAFFELYKLEGQEYDLIEYIRSFILDIFKYCYYNYKSVVRKVTSDHYGEVISRIIQIIKEGRTYIYNLINRRVVPSNGLNNYLIKSVMHPCNLFKDNQLESVTFQGSACASTQAFFELYEPEGQEYDLSTYVVKIGSHLYILDTYKKSFIEIYFLDIFKHFYYNYKSVVRRVTSDHFGAVISRIIQVIKEGRTYIYNFTNRRVVPSNGLNSLLTKRVMHSWNLQKNNQLESVTFQGSACASTQAFFELCKPEGKEYDLIKYVAKVGSHLYILDTYKKSVIEVHEGDFNRRDLPCFKYQNWTVKYIGEKKESKLIIIKVKSQIFNQETLTESYTHIKNQFTDFLSGISTVFELVAGVGRVSNNVKTKYANLKQNLINPVLDSSVFNLVKDYGVSLIKILMSVCKIVQEDSISILSLSSLVLDIYSMLDKMNVYNAESLESVLIAGVSTILPSTLVNIIKKMSLLTNKKLFDDNGFIYEFFSLLSQILVSIISYFPLKIQEYMNSVLELFGLTEFVFICKAKKLLLQHSRDKHIILEDRFRNDVKILYQELHDLDLKRFFAKNKPLSEVASEFERIKKAVISYEQTSRQEPCCFVFQGPPGCRKSVTVNKVIATLGLTHYSHIVKCSEDSKDWYDSYNNEDIFYMDDVGQMGKSQWRNLINWVSAVKLPLDCAEASLKDTKYFNSELILLTTNNFINLQGFTTKDCIETPEALWRRGYVFDFQNVVGDGNNMKGVVNFKFYDIKSKQFLNDFPIDFKEFLLNREIELNTSCFVENQNEFLTWITTIIMGLRALKKTQLNNNTLLEQDILTVRQGNPFYPEVNMNEMKFIINEYFEYVLDVCKQLVSDFLTTVLANPLMASSALIVGLLVSTLLYKFKGAYQQEGAFLSVSKKEPSNNFLDNFEELNLSKCHSMLPKIASQMFEIDIVFTEGGVTKMVSCHSLISGRKLLVPYHLVLDRIMQIVIYKDRKKNHRLVDHSPVKLIFSDVYNDVAIISLSDGFPSPFPKLASCFQPFNRDTAVGLVFPEKIVKMEGILSNSQQYGPIIYPIGKIMNTVENPITYKELHFPGMCGTVVVTNQGMILGMHVAGHDVHRVGVTLQWSHVCREKIFNVLSDIDSGLKINTSLNNKVIDECSGFKINTNLNVFVPKNSNFVKSPLYGVFDVSRQPANLSVYGPHTVKDISKSSRLPIGPVDNDELNFAGQLLDLYFSDYDDLNEHEIVKGDDMLAPINKKSSNGIFPIKDKLDCFDYEKGSFKPYFRDLYNEFEERMTTGDINVEDIAWSETLKDELRNTEKKEPRSFRVSPVTMQVLTKKCFGKLVKKIVKERWFNEIMIGLNPFTEWPKLYNRMKGGRCWGGDIGKYDKCMRVQVQILVAEKMLQYYKGNMPQAARNILLNIAYNLVVVNDDSWILTHSLPSGCWLTAIFNSLVNRVYTAMWYFREMKNNGFIPDFMQFHNHISDPVYGDDRLNRCIDPKYENFLNAITMEKFFNSLGMEMTDSLKGKITTPFQPVEELTFLKRYFRYHPKLGNITCPLDLRTVYSTLSWIDSSKSDLDIVLRDKINAFQREIFLHYDIYEENIRKLEKACVSENVSFSLLSEDYLIKLYELGTYDDFYSKAYGVLIC